MNKFWLCAVSLMLVIIVTFLSVVLLSDDNKYIFTSAEMLDKNKIIIDAGHGGFDGGAVAEDGTSEKDINLNIALQLGEMLSLNGFDIIYTRTEDIGTDDSKDATISKRKVSDLKNRLNLMSEHPDSIFVSVHLNKFTSSSATGAQVFFSPAFDKAKDLSLCVQNSIVSILQPDNKRVIKKGTSSTYLLHKAKVPAIIVECGFISNHKELELLKSSEYQKQMAFAIYCGILNYYK